MKILITGATGFVGRVLLNQLLASESKARIEKLYLIENKNRISTEVVDSLRNHFDVQSIRQNLVEPWSFSAEVDFVVNLAADGSQKPYSSRSTRTYLQINKQFLKWSAHRELAQIIHVSSGICDYLDVNSNDEILHNSDKRDFAIGRKIVEEEVCSFFQERDVPSRVLRLYTFIGKELLSRPQYAVNDFMMMAARDGVIRVRGNSKSLRTYLSEGDLGRVLDETIFSSAFPNQVSVASTTSVSMEELAKRVAIEFQADIEFLGEQNKAESYIPEHASKVLPDKSNILEPWNDTLHNLAKAFTRGQE